MFGLCTPTKERSYAVVSDIAATRLCGLLTRKLIIERLEGISKGMAVELDDERVIKGAGVIFGAGVFKSP